MAEYDKEAAEEMIRKTTWRSVGIFALWLALIFAGIAFERLGLVSGLLTGILPGEGQVLRQQLNEEQNNLLALTSEKEEIQARLGRLRKARDSYVQCQTQLEKLRDTPQGASTSSAEG